MRPMFKANVAGLAGAVAVFSIVGVLFGIGWLFTMYKFVMYVRSSTLLVGGVGWFFGMMVYIGQHRKDFES